MQLTFLARLIAIRPHLYHKTHHNIHQDHSITHPAALNNHSNNPNISGSNPSRDLFSDPARESIGIPGGLRDDDDNDDKGDKNNGKQTGTKRDSKDMNAIKRGIHRYFNTSWDCIYFVLNVFNHEYVSNLFISLPTVLCDTLLCNPYVSLSLSLSQSLSLKP